VLLGAFITALYTFRMLFMTFHGKELFRCEAHHDGHDDHGHHESGVLAHAPHESPGGDGAVDPPGHPSV